jgi:hypothetical protein
VRAASRGGQARFDWSDPTTWESAVTGTAGMYLMGPRRVSVEPSFVQFAVDRGIRRIVLLSSQSIEAMGDARLLARRGHRARLRGGLDHPAGGLVSPELRRGVVPPRRCWPVYSRCRWARPARCSWTPRTSLRSRWPRSSATATPGRTYALTGPWALSFAQALESIGQGVGTVGALPRRGQGRDYLAEQTALGAPEEQTRQEVNAFAALRVLGDAQPTDVVWRVTGREPKDVATFAAEAAARGVWRG